MKTQEKFGLQFAHEQHRPTEKLLLLPSVRVSFCERVSVCVAPPSHTLDL